MTKNISIEEALNSLVSENTLEKKIEIALENKMNWAPNLRLLSSVIGDIEALKFAEALGGVSHYIPTSVTKSSPIFHAISPRAFELLTSSHLRGAYFICPMEEMKDSPQKIAKQLLQMGYPQRQIALHTGLHEKTVMRLSQNKTNNQGLLL